MKFVEPIRDVDDIARMKAELSGNMRNYTLFVVGINSGPRIEDLLQLKVRQVTSDKDYIEVVEQKTGKLRQFTINQAMRTALDRYIKAKDLQEYDYLFPSQKRDKDKHQRPITRIQAYRIIKAAADKVGLKRIGTHSMRKTFGYQYYKRYGDVAELMDIYNHSSQDITLRYIGVTQEIKHKKIMAMNL